MRFKILEIHRLDAYFRTNNQYINKVFEGEIEETEFFEGWQALATKDGKRFIGVKLEVLPDEKTV